MIGYSETISVHLRSSVAYVYFFVYIINLRSLSHLITSLTPTKARIPWLGAYT